MELPTGKKVRTELILYAPEAKEQYVEMLRFLAHYPHDNGRWIYYRTTIPNGTPPEPFFKRSKLSTIFLTEPILKGDRELTSRLRIKRTAIDLLWVIPITDAECELKLNRGADALYDAFNRVQLPFVLDERRRSCVLGPDIR